MILSGLPSHWIGITTQKVLMETGFTGGFPGYLVISQACIYQA
jgi:hypothetical protein